MIAAPTDEQVIARGATITAEQRSLTDPDAFDFSVFGILSSLSGVSIGPRTACRVPAVRAAVQAISEAAGQLPLVVVETDTTGQRRAIREHPLHAILNDAANAWTPARAFREQFVRDALLHGDGFGWIVRDGTGTVRELIRLRPGDMTATEDVTDPLGPPIYRLRGITVNRADVIHIRCPLGPTGATGISPIDDAREAIALASTMEAHAARLFANGGRPSGILSFPQRLTAEVAKRIRESWKAATSGANSGGTAVLEEGGNFTPLTFNSVDNQFAELRAFQLAEIARAFRVPPTMLQDYGRATWGNSAKMMRIFVNLTLQPWLQKVEGEFALKLFTPDERIHLALEHDIDQLVNANPLDRAKAAQLWRASGVKTANDLRADENLPPRDDGDSLTSPFTTAGTDKTDKEGGDDE